MSKWMDKLRKKRTVPCFFCETPTGKKTAFSITIDSKDGAHTVLSCEPCALEFDSILKEIEEIHNE